MKPKSLSVKFVRVVVRSIGPEGEPIEKFLWTGYIESSEHVTVETVWP